MICRRRPDGNYVSKGQVQGHSSMKTAKTWKGDEEETEGRRRGDGGEMEGKWRKEKGDRGEMEGRWNRDRGGRWRGVGREMEGR